MLTREEFRRVYAIGVEEASGKVPLVAGLYEMASAKQVIDHAKDAVAARVDAIQVYQLRPGHGQLPSPAEQERYWRDILEAVDHPLMLSIHGVDGYRASVALLKQLCSEYKQIRGINLSGQPTNFWYEVRDALPASVGCYSAGNPVHMIALGAAGFLMAENNIIPNLVQAIVDNYKKGDTSALEQTVRIQQQFLNIVSPIGGTARYVPTALTVLGLPAGTGYVRRPYLLPSEAEQRKLADAFAALRIRELEGLVQAAPTPAAV